MFDDVDSGWEKRVVAPEAFLSKIEPGMSIFLGIFIDGVAGWLLSFLLGS